MTANEFNQKYQQYLEPNFDGLDINDADFIAWLDNKFQEFIKVPNFRYSQIKLKWGRGCFYCEGLSQSQIDEVEEKISEING